MKRICTIYKSPKEDEMYLYVDKQEDLKRVPEALLERFGTPKQVTMMVITPDKKLARVEASKVLEAIQNQGFYLQMPPPKEGYMLDVHQHNTKMNGLS
ncbi:MAG: YcgL domain-containing protein [Cellvibrionaceae bacterium]